MHFLFTQPSFQEEVVGVSIFFIAPGGDRTPIADSKVTGFNLYTIETHQCSVLCMYKNIPEKNCNVVGHYCKHLSVHRRALTGAPGGAPGRPPGSLQYSRGLRTHLILWAYDSSISVPNFSFVAHLEPVFFACRFS